MYLEEDYDHTYMKPILQITSVPQEGKWDGLTKEQSDLSRLVNYSIISALIGLFGIVTNVMNMIVFSKQGLNTTSNISFFALALSDLLCVIAIELADVLLNPYLETDSVPFIPFEIQYLTLGWTSICFGRITSWITVYITAERSLAVALPLQVKQIINVKRTATAMCVIFILNLMTIFPEYCVAYYDWKFVPGRNKTLYGLMFRSNKDVVNGLVFFLTSTSGMLSFVAVIVLTLFLVIKLGQNSRGRLKTALNNNNSETRAIRDKKTVKMVVMIASILIICYIPAVVMSLVSVFEPEFMLGGKYVNSCLACWSAVTVFSTINPSVNTILYYNMSTKYRTTFNKLFCGPETQDDKYITK